MKQRAGSIDELDYTDKSKIDRVEQHQKELKTDMEIIRDDVKLIKHAIMGNPITEDKGMVGQIREVEYEQKIQKQEIETIKKEQIQNSVYMRIILWVSGSAFTILIGYILSKFLKITI
jgi:hypothetical protein